MTDSDVHQEVEESRRKIVDLDVVAALLIGLGDQDQDVHQSIINAIIVLGKYSKFPIGDRCRC